MKVSSWSLIFKIQSHILTLAPQLFVRLRRLLKIQTVSLSSQNSLVCMNEVFLIVGYLTQDSDLDLAPDPDQFGALLPVRY